MNLWLLRFFKPGSTPQAPMFLYLPPLPPSSGTEGIHRVSWIWGTSPHHTLDAESLSLGQGSGRGVLWGLRWEEEREEKQMRRSLEEAFPFPHDGASPTQLPPQKAKTHSQQKTYTHICKLQYKRAANLMIRDYYLKGPTVTDLFVISCNNTNGNEFICINVSVTRTSVEIPH